MSRIPRLLTNPQDPQSIVKQLEEVVRVVDDKIEFGEPQDPYDLDSVKLAGTTGAGAHNGTHSNISGSWVEVALTSTGITDAVFRHNLYLSNPQYAVPVSGSPNVRWLEFGWLHDGTGADGTTTYALDLAWVGGTVNANDITLRCNIVTGGTAPTIDGTHPVTLTLFFTRATQ